jgi:sulfate adenylyltransferase subunit 1
MGNTREQLKIVVVGHVDHGKSTLIGRLLYDTKSLPEGTIDRAKRISKEKGKPFEYAYLLDALEEEQKQGITIDTTQLQFRTEARDYVIIDAPGHKEFLKNMISGAANAEAALLIIDANEGIQEQSKRHGYILSLLGIKKVYVIVNKMDLIDYSEEKFNIIYNKMNSFLNSLGVYPLRFIPVSAFNGENIVTSSDKMPWYDGEPVIKAIDLIQKETGLEDKPLRFPIQDVYKFDQRRIIAGRIEAGSLSVGDEILISPSKKVTKVKTIEYFTENDRKDTVSAGMSVGITLEDEFFNKRGELISHKNEAPLVGEYFKANLFWMGKNSLVQNRRYKLKLVTQEVDCEIHSINKVIDASTLEAYEAAEKVNTNDVAEVIIKTREPICFDEFSNNSNTGRFVIVDGYDVSGGGIISGIEEDRQVTGRLIKGDIKIKVDCFSEYYLLIPEGTIKKLQQNNNSYYVGDALPLKGDTYLYADNFNLVDIKNSLTAKIRDGKLEDILKISEYNYEALPYYSTEGFFIKIESSSEFDDFEREIDDIEDSENPNFLEFNNKWLNPFKNKEIKFVESFEAGI